MARFSVAFAEDRCKGCGLCVTACPLGIVVLDKTRINLKGHFPAAVTDVEKCIGCTSCAMMCPDNVITIERM